MKDILLHEDIIKFKQNKMHVLGGKLELLVSKVEHDNPLARHRGKKSIIYLALERLYWFGMK